MLETLSGWELDVERGPDWLFVKIRDPKQDVWESPPLAERLVALLQEHLVHRLILQLDEVGRMGSSFIGQLVLLHKRIVTHGGLMRLCGLSPSNQEVLHLCRLDERFACYRNREEAVMGTCFPRQPR